MRFSGLEKKRPVVLFGLICLILLVYALFYQLALHRTQAASFSYTLETYEESGFRYPISMEYPNTNCDALNADVQHHVLTEIQKAKQLAPVAPDEEEDWAIGGQSRVTVWGDLVSIVLTVQAGEETRYQLLLYHLPEGTPLSPDDLFTGSEDKNELLRRQALPLLRTARKEKGMPPELPDDKTNELLQRVAPGEDGLTVYCDSDKESDPLREAITVTIPYGRLRAVLNPDYFQIPEPEPAAQAAQENFSPKAAVSVADPSKVIAFTFDDGPHPTRTAKLLDYLERTGQVATFYVVGSRAEQQSGILNRMVSLNCEIGNHSYDHASLKKLPPEQVIDEIERTNTIIQNATGTNVRTVRTPYGQHEDGLIALVNHPVVLWNVDSQDWKSKNAEAVKNEILTQAQPGSIILAHDIFETSVDGAIAAIDCLKEQGYTLVTVSQLLELQSGSPVQVYYEKT